MSISREKMKNINRVKTTGITYNLILSIYEIMIFIKKKKLIKLLQYPYGCGLLKSRP